MDIRNFVIDRVRRGIMLHSSTREVLWSINQVENPSLNVTAETNDAVDALGTPIMTFNRAKNAEFSAESSLFDLGLLAAQSGKSVDVATSGNTYNVPYMDEIKIITADTLTVTRTPAIQTGETYGVKFVYKMNGDGTLGEKFTAGASASGNTFSISGKVITFANGKAAVGDKFFAFYDYEASDASGSGAAQVINTAVDFPTAGRFLLEVLGVDVCDPSTLYSAYIEFPNAKLMSEFQLGFTTDAKHPFTLKAMQDYCDGTKKLFRIVIPEAATAA